MTNNYTEMRKYSHNQETYYLCKNSVFQQWAKYLTTHELTVLLYIIERTLRYNKPSEFILRNCIQNDLVDKAGEIYQCGINVSSATYSRCIKRLREIGFISCELRGHAGYRLNWVTVHSEKILEKPPYYHKVPYEEISNENA